MPKEKEKIVEDRLQYFHDRVASLAAVFCKNCVDSNNKAAMLRARNVRRDMDATMKAFKAYSLNK